MAGSEVAILIVNYNMPERTDKLAEYIFDNVMCPYELIVIDNGSDLMPPSIHTTLRLEQNVQTTRGWLAGLDAVRARQYDPFAYWFLITSAEFPEDGGDPLTPMVQFLRDNPQAVGIHPALTADSTSAWQHLFTRNENKPRQTWMIDNIASLYRADWLDSQGWFDPEMVYAWGIDLETGWKARSQGRSLWVDERVKVKKVTNIGYSMDRMRMSAEERVRHAAQNMQAILSTRYGKDWNWKMRQEYVTLEMT